MELGKPVHILESEIIGNSNKWLLPRGGMHVPYSTYAQVCCSYATISVTVHAFDRSPALFLISCSAS